MFKKSDQLRSMLRNDHLKDTPIGGELKLLLRGIRETIARKGSSW